MNWPELINLIMSRGVSQRDISKRLGCAQSTISCLLIGKAKEPGHALGQALIQLERNTRRRKPKERS